jgi:hypothetical protein
MEMKFICMKLAIKKVTNGLSMKLNQYNNMETKLRKRDIERYLRSGLGVPVGIRMDEYKPGLGERLSFFLVRGREIKEEDYKPDYESLKI